MKRIISVLLAFSLIGNLAFAQDKQEKKKGRDWREKMRAEQIAFITSELDLSESEAQAFWPVYNDIQKQRREAFHASGEAFANLQKGADSEEAGKLLDKYIAARKACDKLETDSVVRYKKVLPVSKVAKLMMAEEKFRQNQIHRLGRGRGPGQDGCSGAGAPPAGRELQTNEPSIM